MSQTAARSGSIKGIVSSIPSGLANRSMLSCDRRKPDVTGLNKSSGSERESLSKGAGHADEEVQAGADRNAAAVD
jgi:hypothetical protein